MPGHDYRYKRDDRGRLTFRRERQADGSWHTTHVTDGYDRSPVHQTHPGYDSRCSLCWLSATHSEAAHRERLAEGIRQMVERLEIELRRDERCNPWRADETRRALDRQRADLAAVVAR